MRTPFFFFIAKNPDAMAGDQTAYYELRMKELGVTEQNNQIEVYNPEAEPPMSKVGTERIFWYDQQGNITINYWTVEGHAIVYYPSDVKNSKPTFYQTKRLLEPRGDMKYQMPKGQGTFPWFHPATVDAFKKGEHIDTIYLTEGVFKAWAAGQHGLHVVGLASITCYAGRDGQLHRDIVRLMERCSVDNVVILWDGDCLNVSVKGIQVREEATKRPFGFFNSAKQIRKLVHKCDWEKPRATPAIHFMSVQSEAFAQEKPKGLDDLLIVAEQKELLPQVLGDIKRLRDKGPYFYRLEITSTTDLLFRHFALGKEDVEKFYHRHSDVIGETEFLFRGSMYAYSEAENKLVLLQPEWAKSIYWVGDEFFEEQREPSAKENFSQKMLRHRKKETLTARFGRDFIRYLKYYSGFVNVPEHFNYERIIEVENKEYFNQYFPFPHIPEEGKWENIKMFLFHIFGDNVVRNPKTDQTTTMYQMGLDYLQLLLTQPTQQLPILVLYSPENSTGKSTFGELCYQMLGDNVVFIGNSDLESDFNEVYAGRLLAICEETLLERRKDAERIKNISTASRVTINPKGQKQYSIDNFLKFQFYSNNPRMVYVTKHDERYWILRVPVIPEDQRDPELKERMWAEIPAFIHYLKNRQMATTHDSRMWFHPAMLRTEVFIDTVRLNEPTAATDMRIMLRDMFIEAGPQCQEIRMPLKNVVDEFFKGTKNSRSWAQELVRDYLCVDLLRNEAGQTIYERGSYTKLVYNEYADDGEGAIEEKVVKWKGRPYVFKRADFVQDEGVIYGLEPDPAHADDADWLGAPSQDDDETPF